LVNCKIDSLPAEIFYLDKLKEINLEGNRIQTIPKEILKMPNLQFLNLKNNKLTTITEFIAYMPSLQVLDIRGNMIPLPELDILRILFKRKSKILYSDYEKLLLEQMEEQKKNEK
jgi:Leucine-rich repeat (LRR) protein